jgi:hypothetical protein
MEHYGIKGNIHRWVSSWLTQRHKRICVDEEKSSNKLIRSGFVGIGVRVPYGTPAQKSMEFVYLIMSI